MGCTYVEYLGAGFLVLPTDALKGLPKRLRRSDALFPSTLLFPRLCRLTKLPPSCGSWCCEDNGELGSLECLLAIEWRFVDDEPDSAERPNMRRRLLIEGTEGPASFCARIKLRCSRRGQNDIPHS